MITIAAVAMFFAYPTCAYACSCVPPGSPAEELGRSDAVFLGKVVDVKTPSGPITSSADSTSATLEISTVWKGQVAQTITLTTPGSSASCGVTFEQGKEYVVYAQVSDGVLSTTLCSRTRPAGDAAEDVAALGAGQPPQASQQAPAGLPATGADADGGGGATLLFAALGALAAAAGAAIAALGRASRVREGQ
jgi:hypothetical protein